MVIMEFVPLEDYNTIMGTRETLEPGEAFVIPYRTEFSEDELKINDYVRFKVKKVSNDFIYSASAAMDAMPTIIVIVPDMRESLSVFENMADYRGAQLMSMKWTYNFDTSVVKEKQAELNRDIRNNIGDETFSGNEMIRIQSESREANRDDYYSLFGGLFYIAIILSIVFIIAAVLIIYYKQISEGYEDRARFDIMQKVA